MNEPIQLATAAALQINEIIKRRAGVEEELRNAVSLVLAVLGAPGDWLLRVDADGAIWIVPPPGKDTGA